MFLLDCTGFKERENKEKKLADKYIYALESERMKEKKLCSCCERNRDCAPDISVWLWAWDRNR